MKKKMKKIVGFCLVITLLLGISIPAYAETTPPELGKTVDGSTLIDEDFSEITFYNYARGNILNRGVAKVTKVDSNTVNAYGAVIGAVACDTMELTIVLQRYNGSSWTNVASKTYSASNVGFFTKSFNTTVTSGYYYRVKAACVAKDGGTVESQIPITDGIWV